MINNEFTVSWTEKDPEKDIEMNNLHIDEELEVEDSKYYVYSVFYNLNYAHLLLVRG